MTDAICGPSNALQSFQKHNSVDRTLQQDRLVGQRSPSQGFRSSPGPNTGALDHEFEAFQAGQLPLPQSPFQHLPPHLSRPPPPQLTQSLQGSDWASDFQRLNISRTQQMPSQRISAPDVASSWHQEFMNQQGPAAHLQSSQHQDRFGATPAYGMSSFVRPGFQPASFGMMGGSGKSMSEVSQGKQRASESIPQLDAAAFERAFAAAQQAEEEAYTESQRQQQSHKGDAVADDLLQEEEDAALARIREKRPAVYAALKIRSAVELRTPSKASQFLDVLETMEINHELTKDASEARWVVDTLQKIAEEDIPQDVKTRSEKLIRAINERLMSTYPLLSTPAAMNSDRIWEELEAAGYIKPRESEQILQPEPRLEQKEEGQQHSQHDDDEMAQTAGHLLERVSDNTSEKFKNSQFLSLMRRLRDREVRVEGDKMVEVSTAQSTSSSSSPSLPQSFQSQVPSQSTEADPASGFEHFNDIYPPSGMDWGWYDPPSPAALPATMVPPIDPHILEHAATDFAAPVYSGEEQQESI